MTKTKTNIEDLAERVSARFDEARKALDALRRELKAAKDELGLHTAARAMDCVPGEASSVSPVGAMAAILLEGAEIGLKRVDRELAMSNLRSARDDAMEALSILYHARRRAEEVPNA